MEHAVTKPSSRSLVKPVHRFCSLLAVFTAGHADYTLRIAASLVMAFAVAGCHVGTLSSLDEETAALIAKRQRSTLGPDAVHDPMRVPMTTTATLSPRARTSVLTTVNPGVRDLPATVPAGDKVDGDAKGSPPSPVTGDGVGLDMGLDLDLEKALAYAIINSPEYRSELEEVYVATLSMLSEQHLWGPRFFNTFSVDLSGTPARGDTDHALSLVNEFSVSHRLPNGGSVSASALVNYVDALRADTADDDDTQSASISLALEKPLLRGAGAVARESLIQAKRDLVYAVRDFERFRREFLLQVSTDYFDLIQQSASVSNLGRQLKNLEWLHNRIGALAKAGREAPFEVQRVGQQMLFARNNLINAEEAYNTDLDRFKVQLGAPLDTPIKIVPKDINIPTPMLDPVSAVAAAHRYRLDLQTSADRVDDTRRRVAVAKNDLLPGLDFDAAITIGTDAGDDFGKAKLDAKSGSYTLGLTYDAALDRKRELIAYRRALVRLEQSRRGHALLRDQISQQVRRSVRQIEQARFTLDQQQRNIEIAQKRLRGVVLRLRSLGPRDFIEAQDDLLEAENRRDAAQRDIRVNVLRYLLDTGQLRVNPSGNWLPPVKLVPTSGPEPAPGPQAMLRYRSLTRTQ